MVARSLRLLLPLLVIVFLLVSGAGVAVAEGDGLTPPPTDPTKVGLADQYPPDSLSFYTSGGLKQMGNRMISNILAAAFDFAAWVAKWTSRFTDYAWNFNLARFTGAMIDPVNTRITGTMWKFGGLLCTFIGAWMAVKVYRDQMSRLTAGLVALAVVLGVAIWSQAGISSFVADVEDAFSDVSGALMTAATDPSKSSSETLLAMNDGIYKQLILENWARANFDSLEVAKKPEYMQRDIPGDVFLGLTEERADKEFKRLGGTDNQDLSPWYSDRSVRTRAAVTVNTLLSVLLFIPVMLILSILVLGAKGLTVIFAMAFPVAVFFAAMPWFSGIRFLKGYMVVMFVAPIVKIFCSLGLALYLAFLGGLMDAAQQIPGGWATITMIAISLLVTTWWLGKPIARALGSLLFSWNTNKQQKAAPASAPHAHRAPQPNYRSRVQPRNQPAGHVQTSQHKPRRLETGVGHVVTYKALKGRGQNAVQQHAHASHHHRQHQQHTPQRRATGQVEIVDILREARRIVRFMAHAAATSGGGR